jgi:hypothetical protein
LQTTKGFSELILASKGTVQGFLISLALYIESCISQIFSKQRENRKHSEQVRELVGHLNTWRGRSCIKKRAMGLLSMLNSPDVSKRIDTLIKEGVISETHKQIWKKARPYLAHGGIVDFSKIEEFWHYRNYFISIAYRLTFRILGYKGKVLDYDGSEFRFIDFKWRHSKP